ncbi:MAG: tRNA pseudouridine(65) synthase TruC [Bdellovibrionales bacterium]|nr:tRNA pseudouridine(65) synthase TruC [Bdellovibrionales bacterium]
MTSIRILYQDEHLLVVDKPAGIQVHPPERGMPGASVLKEHMVKNLRIQTGKYIYPVHRLDGATSGVMVFALSSEIASKLQKQFKERTVKKDYFAVARGWLQGQFTVADETHGETNFISLHRFEIDRPIGKHARSRYTLVLARPKTGKMHQIRRSLKHESHPIVGDTVYGDGKHNRLWRELVPGSGLFLKAYSLEFTHPMTGEKIYHRSKWGRRWHALFDQAGFCPIKNPA